MSRAEGSIPFEKPHSQNIRLGNKLAVRYRGSGSALPISDEIATSKNLRRRQNDRVAGEPLPLMSPTFKKATYSGVHAGGLAIDIKEAVVRPTGRIEMEISYMGLPPVREVSSVREEFASGNIVIGAADTETEILVTDDVIIFPNYSNHLIPHLDKEPAA